MTLVACRTVVNYVSLPLCYLHRVACTDSLASVPSPEMKELIEHAELILQDSLYYIYQTGSA